MLKAAKQNSGKSKIIAVTVLTSNKLKHELEVLDLVKDSVKAKVDGIVCSGHELDQIKSLSGSKKLIKVVPGIRPNWYKAKDDQNRKMTPKDAMNRGADFLVIGRPITKNKSKETILNSLENIFGEEN